MVLAPLDKRLSQSLVWIVVGSYAEGFSLREKYHAPTIVDVDEVLFGASEKRVHIDRLRKNRIGVEYV